MGKVYIIGNSNHMKMGKDTAIYPQTVFEISEDATLQIGDHFTFSYGALIACHKKISIGDNVSVGEYTSIRDTTHGYNQEGVPYNKQPDKSDNIIIGNNVWIGRGCIVLPGTVIEDGVIVGANSVVKGHLKSYHLYAGAPARLIRGISEQLSDVKFLFRSRQQHADTAQNNVFGIRKKP